jgi:hypothetical protein
MLGNNSFMYDPSWIITRDCANMPSSMQEPSPLKSRVITKKTNLQRFKSHVQIQRLALEIWTSVPRSVKEAVPVEIKKHLHKDGSKMGHSSQLWSRKIVPTRMKAALHSHTHTSWLNFWVLGHLWSQNDVIKSYWGWQPPQATLFIHIKHIQSVWAHQYAVHRQMVAALHSHTHTSWLRCWVLGHLWSQHDVITSWLRLTATSNCFPHPY